MAISSREVARVFKALSDVTRVEIIQLLGEAPRNVTDLTSRVGVSQPKVSRHLKILRDAGLLRDVRKGKWVWYEIAEARRGEPASEALSAVSSLFFAGGMGATRTAATKNVATPRSTPVPGKGPGPVHGNGPAASQSAVRRKSLVPTPGHGKSPTPAQSDVRRKSAAPSKRVATPKSVPGGPPRRKSAPPVMPVEKERSRKSDIEDFLL